MVDLSFYKNKKVFITGHTGFKGSWLSKILISYGAIVKGYALEPEKNSLYSKITLDKKMESIYGDIRDFDKLKKEIDGFNPEIIFHLAAQPIVLKSYEETRYTYETNVMGIVNVLECIKNSKNIKSFINVTTDKVYENEDNKKSFKEDDKLNGFDPYSNSKSCSELITSSYKKSFFDNCNIGISTVRAGNVLGGGDYGENRIIPDCIRAAKGRNEIIVRNPNSIRPYQHVLDALFAYLLIAEKQYNDNTYSGCYNIGPDDNDIITTQNLVELFCNKWGNGISWKRNLQVGPHESNFLKLNCEKMKLVFDWKPSWNIDKTIEKIIEFEKYDENRLEECMEKQINEFSSK